MFAISQDQLDTIVKWLREPAVIIAVCTWISKGYKSLRRYLNSVINTAIGNMESRITADLKSYIDKRIIQHERNAFSKIDESVKGVKEVVIEVAKEHEK